MIGNTSKTDQRVLNAQHEQWETKFAFKLKMLGAEPSYPALSSGRVSRARPSAAADGAVVQKDWGVRLDAEMAWLRRDRAGRIERRVLIQRPSQRSSQP